MDDFVLTKNIKKILEDKMQASAMDINVQCKNNNVQLSGMVDVLAEKVFAENLVKELDNVNKVENNITIATDGYIPDKDISSYVQDKLQNVKSLASVSPKVQDGSVTLVGTVNSEQEKKNALNLSSQARGVKSVASNIKISSEDNNYE